ncbi:MAG: MotA/TolQ/ExbB proton channel family protein [Limnochordales bacterium]|nr:MotA/TolQ/ExbB proton channel family protein [Limnochordales bacterium]
MQWSAIVGFVLGSAMLLVSMGIGPELKGFWDWPSLLLVMGGALAGTSINYPFAELRKLPRLIWLALHKSDVDPEAIEERIVRLAEKARRDGLLSLEDELEDEPDPFLRKAIQLVVDGVEPEQVAAILENDIAQIQYRHQTSRGVLETIARLLPAFGMIGTLVGLVQMLSKLSDPSTIGPAMALALLTTFYGAVLAYLIFLPLAGSLRLRTEQEVRYRQAVVEGMLALQAGENPMLIAERLRGFRPSQRATEKGTDQVREAMARSRSRHRQEAAVQARS